MEKDISFTPRMVGLPDRSGAGGTQPDAQPGGGPVPSQRPPGVSGQPDFRGGVRSLFPAPWHLLRTHGHLLKPVPRRDAGEDAPLLFPDPNAARGAGGWKVSGRPASGAGAVCAERDTFVLVARPASGRRVVRVLTARPRALQAGQGSRGDEIGRE